nr:MAG TPA: hypothetical protein [Caudoviricetes sp.]
MATGTTRRMPVCSTSTSTTIARTRIGTLGSGPLSSKCQEATCPRAVRTVQGAQGANTLGWNEPKKRKANRCS